MSRDLLEAARDVVRLEGWYLDQRDWDSWLNLYATDATYWLPCWLDDDTYTRDPNREMSLIYYNNRTGLEDRIYRIRTEQSLASLPLPRTCHMVSVAAAAVVEDGLIEVKSSWTVHCYKLGKTHVFFGNQTHQLRGDGDALKIVLRKTILLNDVIPNSLDVYHV